MGPCVGICLCFLHGSLRILITKDPLGRERLYPWCHGPFPLQRFKEQLSHLISSCCFSFLDPTSTRSILLGEEDPCKFPHDLLLFLLLRDSRNLTRALLFAWINPMTLIYGRWIWRICVTLTPSGAWDLEVEIVSSCFYWLSCRLISLRGPSPPRRPLFYWFLTKVLPSRAQHHERGALLKCIFWHIMQDGRARQSSRQRMGNGNGEESHGDTEGENDENDSMDQKLVNKDQMKKMY